ncbi:MAG TPA: hypothetical protein PLR52_06435 [Bacteroidales bacterium]|nr:hypothetical protein [Bacteroidales bacterium]
MSKKDGIRSDRSSKKGTNALRDRILIFAVFLFLSFIFWYLNSLGKNLETDIKYPVRFINPPGDDVLAEDKLPSKLNLYLTGPGYSILDLKMSGNRAPVIIDLSKVSYRPVQSGEPSDYFIVTSALVEDIGSQLKSVCKVTGVKPDTLFFSFEKETD